MLGGSGADASYPIKIGAVWCILVYILIRFPIINIFLNKTYCYIKNNYYIDTHLLWGRPTY